MKPLIDYIKPHLLYSWEHAASFSHIRQRMTTPWQTCMLVWSLRRILVINMIIWLPVVVAYRYFVSVANNWKIWIQAFHPAFDGPGILRLMPVLFRGLHLDALSRTAF